MPAFFSLRYHPNNLKHVEDLAKASVSNFTGPHAEAWDNFIE